jgi:serine/threonine protein kinase
MGVVYKAEQHTPRRIVSLKVVKLGMDSKQVVARFEAERQALGMLSHPNVAKVLDGGMTDRGRPYFAMEYVPGIPLTLYCQRNNLSIRARAWPFSSPSATPSSTLTRRGSFIATLSLRTSSCRCRTDNRCPRSSISASPKPPMPRLPN